VLRQPFIFNYLIGGDKMKKSLVFLSVLLLLVCCNVGFAQDQPRDLVASLAQIPGLADSPDKGFMVDIVKAMDDVYPGNIKIMVAPFERSIRNVMDGKADFHMPTFRNPAVPESKLPYRFAAEPWGVVSLVIYSNKDKIITKNMIDDALAKGGKFPYVIELAGGVASNFPFPSVASNSAEQSLQKVQNKRIDATIFGSETDLILKQIKLNAIHREHYKNFDNVLIISKGAKSVEMDKTLSDCLKKIKASGRLEEINKYIYFPYTEWQPANMGW
jgi:polar amino acid transport system substrate-binding protein